MIFLIPSREKNKECWLFEARDRKQTIYKEYVLIIFTI